MTMMDAAGVAKQEQAEKTILSPFGERIIIRKQLNEKVGMIYVPEAKQKASIVGEVIAVGPEADWVDVGDKVLFGKHAGFELPVNDELEEYRGCILMNNCDLLAKL